MSGAPDGAYEQLHAEFEGVLERGHMMSSPALKSGSRMLAFVHEQSISIKLGRDSPAHAEALALGGAELFHPGGGQRVFYDWVTIPASHRDRWAEFVQRSVDLFG